MRAKEHSQRDASGDRGPLPARPPAGEDFYASVDMGRARRLGGVIVGFAFLCMGMLLALTPPTAPVGDLGWPLAAAIALGVLGGALRLRLGGERVGPNEMLAMSYWMLASIAVLEWLSGGENSPYSQLYMLPVLWTVFVHPRGRVLAFFAAYASAVAWSLHLRGGLGSPEVGELAMQVLIQAGMGIVGMVLISGLRAQRRALRAAEEEARERAETDQLTGLGNRRRLMASLEAFFTEPNESGEGVLVLLDLDGFKAYNDTFGHPAGDELLTRLAHNLDGATGTGEAYRMGGDEFCVLSRVGGDLARAVAQRAEKALSEHGEGFTIGASHGMVRLPSEANNPSEALRVADRRMYARKATQRKSPGMQSAAALIELLAHRSPDLRPHSAIVAGFCEAVGRRLGLDDEELATLLVAAPLHDIGKAAIPDAILNKEGPLDEEEWSFVRRHTLIGDRILRAAPALAGAATLVRCSHERWDGKGYPDGLSGEDIPIGARVIAVCDAYDAMVSKRPYSRAMSPDEAIAELRREAGRQFDLAVVDAFVAVLDERSRRRPERLSV
jgi:two-component system cell cycle response regulator